MGGYVNQNNQMMDILNRGPAGNGAGDSVKAPFASMEPDADDNASTQMTPIEAGYLELEGATQDSSCEIVSGGISSELGCCNAFRPQSGTGQFSCGTCVHVQPGGGDQNLQEPDLSETAEAQPQAGAGGGLQP